MKRLLTQRINECLPRGRLRQNVTCRVQKTDQLYLHVVRVGDGVQVGRRQERLACASTNAYQELNFNKT